MVHRMSVSHGQNALPCLTWNPKICSEFVKSMMNQNSTHFNQFSASIKAQWGILSEQSATLFVGLLGFTNRSNNQFSPSFCPPWTALRYWGPDPARHPSWLHSHCRVQGSSILVAKEGDQAFKYNNCFSWRWPVESEIIQGYCKDGREWNVSSLLDGCNCSSSSKFEC